MEKLFTTFTHAVEGTPAIAVVSAFVWGILSVLLSPCHMASIPLIVGFIGRQEKMSTRRALAASTLFALGILITIAIIGVITAAVGRMAGDLGSYSNYFVAVVFFAVGLNLLDVIPMPWSGSGQVGFQSRGLLAALVLGLVFGVALGPCTFAFMAPILAAAFKIASTNFIRGISLLVAYGLGHCTVIVLAGTSTGLVQHYMDWNERSRGAVILRKICGVLVLLAGLYLIFMAR